MPTGTEQPTTPQQYLEFLENLRKYLEKYQEMMAKQPQQRQQAGGGGGGPGFDLSSLMGGGEGAGGGAGGGTGGAGGGASSLGSAWIPAAIIGAIIGQHALSRKTERQVEGQKTSDVFGGSFTTEPWLAYLHDKLELSPTAGEKFDAAVKNKDMGDIAKTLPAAADYWADPIRTWLGTSGEFIGKKLLGETGGKVGSAVMNPIGAILKLFG